MTREEHALHIAIQQQLDDDYHIALLMNENLDKNKEK